jgi:hypothetical protein
MKEYSKCTTCTINEHGDKIWTNEKGEYHRKDGPAWEWSNGTKFWFINDENHREDGPAREFANGDKWWVIHDRLHREDGPAIEYANGVKEYWLDGVMIDEQVFFIMKDLAHDYFSFLQLSRIDWGPLEYAVSEVLNIWDPLRSYHPTERLPLEYWNEYDNYVADICDILTHSNPNKSFKYTIDSLSKYLYDIVFCSMGLLDISPDSIKTVVVNLMKVVWK